MTAADRQRVELLLDLDRDAEARTLVASLLAADPHDVHLLCLLAQSCLRLKDDAGARAAAEAAVRAAPDDDWPQRLLSISLARQGRAGEARQAARQAVLLAPDEWRTHVNRVQVEVTTGRVDLGTEAAARHAVALAPHEPETHAALGSVLLALNRAGDAQQALHEALRLDPDNYGARNDLARVHLRRRHLGQAAEGFAAAAALAPDDQVAARNLHVVVAGVLRRLSWTAMAAVIVTGAAATHHTSGGRIARFVIWVVAMVVAVAVVGTVRVGSRARSRRIIGVVLRRDRLLLVWALLLVASLGAVTVAAFVGDTGADHAASVGWGAILVGTVVTWIRALRLKSSTR